MHEIKFYQNNKEKTITGSVEKVKNHSAIYVDNEFGRIRINKKDITRIIELSKSGKVKKLDKRDKLHSIANEQLESLFESAEKVLGE